MITMGSLFCPTTAVVGQYLGSWGCIRELVYSCKPTDAEALGFMGATSPHSFAICEGDNCVCVLLQKK